jgi:CheY-like chemotaxis protein
LEAQAPGFQPTGREFHVLVVDDNRDAAESLCALLRIWGYQSEPCDDVVEALRLARELRLDCLVVDVDMPGLIGHALAQGIRMQPGFERVKLVALSFRSDDRHVKSSQNAGFDLHFTKPMSKVQIQRLKTLIDGLSERVQVGSETVESV